MSLESHILLPRVDSENRMGLDFHAPRALGRKGKNGKSEFENLDPEARRAAIAMAQFREGDIMKKKLFQVLGQLEGRQRSPEDVEFLWSLEAQYSKALSVWSQKNYSLSRVPSKVDLARWLSSLSSETLGGLRAFNANDLVLVPPGKVSVLLEVLQQNVTTYPEKKENYDWLEFWSNTGADNWKFGITNLQEDLPFDESIYFEDFPANKKSRTNEQIVAEYKARYNKNGVGIMPIDGYVPSSARLNAQGMILDRLTFTVFERPTGARGLPCASASWLKNYLELGSCSLHASYDFLRCRPWVDGR